jgi:putative chitinase
MPAHIPPEMLQQALGIPAARAAAWAGPIAAAAAYAELHNVARLAPWLGQVGHETGRLRYTAEIWGPTAQQLRYEPVTTLSVRLGNIQPGDGRRYAGHGLIQTTGRHNHARVRDRLRRRLGPAVPDFEALPRLLCKPDWAALSAADYWADRDLNRWADAGDHLTLTRRINGGTNGLADRLALTAQARAACILWGYPT